MKSARISLQHKFEAARRQICRWRQRLEIRFWLLVIRLLQNRRARRVVSLGAFALVFTIAGFFLLPSFGSFPRAIADLPAAGSSTVLSVDLPARSPSAQQNLLLIVVDRLDIPSPELQGIWLVLSLPTRPVVTLIPLYPDSLQGDRVQDLDLQSRFKLNAAQEPSQDFFSSLESLDIWWDQYVLLDQVAVSWLAEASAAAAGPAGLAGPVLGQPGRPGPVAATRGQIAQARVWQQICLDSRPLALAFAPGRVRQLLAAHLQTDFAPLPAGASWSQILNLEAGLTCEFPTLPEMAPGAVEP